MGPRATTKILYFVFKMTNHVKFSFEYTFYNAVIYYLQFCDYNQCIII